MPKVPPPQTEPAHSDEDGEDQDNDEPFEQGFWAVEVVPGKTFKQKSKMNIVHITHASLGVEAKGRNVLLSNNLPVCVLTAGKDEHTNLDLRYVSQQEMAFSVSGTSSITLSGYYEYDNLSDDDEQESFFLDQARESHFKGHEEDEDEDGDDEDDETEGRKKDVLVPLSKMAIGDEEDEDEKIDTLLTGNNKKRPAPSADKTQTPANKKAKQESGAPKNINTPNKQTTGTTDKTPTQIGSGNTPQGGKSESNKKASDQKKSEPGSEKKGPPQNQGNKASPGAKPNVQKGVIPLPKPKKLPSGIIVRELESGKGKKATPGRKIFIKYTAKLKDSQEVIEESKDKPFEFRFGIGAVIKGLDLGINGMFVGGKRTLTIPPSLAYGPTGGLNGKVPPNAIIEYDIELVDVINK